MSTPQQTPEQQQDVQRFNQLAQQLEILKMQIQQLEVEKRDVDMALKEAETMTSDVVIYRSVGRLLFKDSLENVKKNLASQQEKGEVRISSLRNREQKITKSVKELQEKLMAKS